MSKLAKEIRSIVDKTYRRAYRSFRYMPQVAYDTVVDAGANRGSFTDAFLQLYQPKKMVLVEAIPQLAEKLKTKYSSNTISVRSCALSDNDGLTQFYLNTSDYSSSLLKIDPRNTEWFGRDLSVKEAIEVETRSLATLLKEEGIEQLDLLKMDLQGAERMVLTGASDLLANVRVIYTEVLFEELYKNSWLFWDLRDFLIEKGFELTSITNVVHSGEPKILQANAVFLRQ